ncbi:hypothetical protein [Furfurilactobacillus cerevisiae]|uniref:hypothetical protein n=1 Tax=Furfurilactobacillus rossiae TaxID=231049 RepID=UPI003B97F845
MYTVNEPSSKGFKLLNITLGWLIAIGLLGLPASILIDNGHALLFSFILFIASIIAKRYLHRLPAYRASSFFGDQGEITLRTAAFFFMDVPEFQDLSRSSNQTPLIGNPAKLYAYYNIWNSMFSILPARPEGLSKFDPSIRKNIEKLTKTMSSGLNQHMSEYTFGYNARGYQPLIPIVNRILNQQSYDTFITEIYNPSVKELEKEGSIPDESIDNQAANQMYFTMSNDNKLKIFFSNDDFVSAAQRIIQAAF